MTTELLASTAEVGLRVARFLREGDPVALPTETVYGLAADAFNEAACRKIFAVKGRPLLDPLIVHVLDGSGAAELAAEIPAAGVALMAAFWPGPLTLVLRKRVTVSDLVTAGRRSVAIRSPAHPVFRAVLEAFGGPLAAPSANPFGYISPTTAQHVLEQLDGRIAAVVDGGPCWHGVESTIVSLLDPLRPVILRPGPISLEEIEAVVGLPVSANGSLENEAEAPGAEGVREGGLGALAPGMLTRHYSPHCPVTLFRRDELTGQLATLHPADGDSWVWLQRPPGGFGELPGQHTWLTEDGDRAVAARELFGLLRRLDGGSARRIFAEVCPEESGLAVAINDRLRRASAR